MGFNGKPGGFQEPLKAAFQAFQKVTGGFRFLGGFWSRFKTFQRVFGVLQIITGILKVSRVFQDFSDAFQRVSGMPLRLSKPPQ